MRTKELDGGEFWLPVEFFDDDFFIGDNRAVADEGELLRPGFAPCTPSSSQPEPPTEAMTDEDDYIAKLTRRMAHTFLFERNGVSASIVKVPAMGTSPESRLLEAGMQFVSSRGSPNGMSQLSSPPSTSLYTAAGKVMRMRQIERQSHCRRIPSPLKKPSAPAKSSVAGFLHNPILTHQPLQADQFYQLKQQQLIKQQLAAAFVWQSKTATTTGRSNRAIDLTTPARSSLHRQHPVTEMNVVLLDIPHTSRPSAGTGVFLPKRVGAPNESRKKPACPSVIPARIFQTLNLNLVDVGLQQRSPGAYALDYELSLAHGNLASAPQKWHQQQYYHYHTPAPPPPPAVTSHEIHLPTEWTY